MSVLNITAENFEQEVLRSQKPVLVDFFATWCGPCKMLSPVIDRIAQEHPEIKVAKVNIDEQMALASRYRIVSIPTLLVFKNGEVVSKSLGAQSKAKILAMLQ